MSPTCISQGDPETKPVGYLYIHLYRWVLNYAFTDSLSHLGQCKCNKHSVVIILQYSILMSSSVSDVLYNTLLCYWVTTVSHSS